MSKRIYVLFAFITLTLWLAPVGSQAAEVEKGEEYIQAEPTLDRLIQALSVVESNGDVNAVGDKNLQHKAYGLLQIRQPCVDDFNRWHGTAYVAQDCLGNPELSYAICRSYLRHYATEKRLGYLPTFEDGARIWNGGPNGYRKDATKQYWEKVSSVLNRNH